MIVQSISQGEASTNPGQGVSRFKSFRIALNIVIGVLLFVAGYFLSASVHHSAPNVSPSDQAKPPRIIQLDVLNGCGIKGAAIAVTSALRNAGFDVVEMKNYKTFSVPQTILIDRVGDLSNVRRVAAALGVAEKNIVQQLNPDYFVDVSVVIGADYSTLRLTH